MDTLAVSVKKAVQQQKHFKSLYSRMGNNSFYFMRCISDLLLANLFGNKQTTNIRTAVKYCVYPIYAEWTLLP